MSISVLKNRKQFASGFTLVELLVVIAIIGVLATLVLLQLGTARAKARDTKRIADINQLRSAQELYYDENGFYTTSANFTIAVLGKFLAVPAMPTDPVTAVAYFYAASPTTSNRIRYQVWSELEQNGPALKTDADLRSDLVANFPSPEGSTVNGTTEACTAAANDCVFDLGTP